MSKAKSFIIDSAIFLIILLIILSIIAAFAGARHAKELFNSLPLKIFWVCWLMSIIAGLIAFKRLRKKIELLIIHISILLIIVGSMLSSKTGHNLWEKITGAKRIRQAGMVIFEGTKENRVVVQPGNRIATLPFYIKLNDFRITYYKPGFVSILTEDNRFYRVPTIAGNGIFIDKIGFLRITRVFKNFKIRLTASRPIAVESSSRGKNPAVELELIKPDGQSETYYIFERFPAFSKMPKHLKIAYQHDIKEYISDVQVIKNNRVILTKSIRVNHPLHFGGYHFYQQSYDEKAGRYTVLLVVSDLGLNIVWAGYILLAVGLCWLFYVNDVTNFLRNKSNGNQI